MDERVATGQGSEQEPIPLPFDRIRRLVPAMVLCLLAMALFFGFLTESLRGDQSTLDFRIAELPVSDTEIAQNHGRLVRDCTVLGVLGAVVAVLWLVWQYRAHANLRTLVPTARFHPAVAAAVWFVPGVNLIAPPLALMELTWAGVPREEGWRSGWITLLVAGWWLAVVSTGILAVWSLVPGLHHDATLAQLFERDHRAVIAAGIAIITTVLTGFVIVILDSHIAQREDRLSLGTWSGWSRRGRQADREGEPDR